MIRITKQLIISLALFGCFMKKIQAAQPAKSKPELVAHIGIRKSAPEMITRASELGNHGHMIVEGITNQRRKPSLTFLKKEPLFKSEQGKNKRMCTLNPLKAINEKSKTLLMNAIRLAQQKCTKEHNNAWSRWQYFSDGSITFVKLTPLSPSSTGQQRKNTILSAAASVGKSHEDDTESGSDTSEGY